jgi:drug/metabolite transporter (DMT)-like permease
MKKEPFHTGVLYMLVSATGLTLTGFFGQFALQEMSLYAVIFWRFLSSLLLSFLLLGMMGQLHGLFEFANFKMHLLRAFFMLISQYTFYFYLEHHSLFNALVLLNTGPLFIPIFSRLFLKHKVTHSTWVGVIVSALGVLCVLQPNTEIFKLGSFMGLLAGVSQAASQIVFGINSKAERGDLSIFYLFLISTCVSFVPYALGEFQGSSFTQFNYWLIFGLGAASLCNQLARATAYQHGSPVGLSPFLYFSILLGGFSDWLVFKTAPNFLSWIGAILVVLGGALKLYLRRA